MPSLYVTEVGATVSREGGRLLVTKQDEVLAALPITRVDNLVLVGNVGVTTPAFGLLLDHGVSVVFLSRTGAFRGRLSGDLGTHLAVRQSQYRRAEDSEFCLALGRVLVEAKIRNSRTRCLRLDETNADPVVLKAAADMERLIDRLPEAADRNALMGMEGSAARAYFGVLRRYVRPPWTFTRRARRPPPDPVNALFSLVYVLLHESCYAALAVAGLDPTRGFFHQSQSGRAALALDLMEVFRPVVADSVVLTLLNKRMLTPDDFAPASPGPGVVLNREGWRVVADQYGQRMATLVQVPGAPGAMTRRVSYQKLLEAQSRALRRYVLGEADAFEPFLAK